jgi:hypothetical protein
MYIEKIAKFAFSANKQLQALSINNETTARKGMVRACQFVHKGMDFILLRVY